MTADTTSKSGRPAIILAIVSCVAAVCVLLGMTFIPAASWLWMLYSAMVVTALLALALGVREWSVPRAKRATVLALIVLALALGLALWGSFGGAGGSLPS